MTDLEHLMGLVSQAYELAHQLAIDGDPRTQSVLGLAQAKLGKVSRILGTVQDPAPSEPGDLASAVANMAVRLAKLEEAAEWAVVPASHCEASHPRYGRCLLSEGHRGLHESGQGHRFRWSAEPEA